uniref:Uncharacterized protein n=1 Tax=Pipistrellus kuhlii TaxID=59472 RepID=A0A7J7W3K3_PIPKU|nr:hypothetical protein mPipKuh1_008130 [Pipistrellus kuhlii]
MAFLDELALQKLKDLLRQIPYPWHFFPPSLWKHMYNRIGCHFHFITGETEFKHSWPRTIWHVPSKPRSESGLSCFQNGVIIPACCFLAFIEGTSDSLAHSTTLQSFTTTYSPLVFPFPKSRNEPSSQIASGAAPRTRACGE